MRVHWTETAINHLLGIYEYIALRFSYLCSTDD